MTKDISRYKSLSIDNICIIGIAFLSKLMIYWVIERNMVMGETLHGEIRSSITMFPAAGNSEGIFFPCSRISLIYEYGTRETVGDSMKMAEFVYVVDYDIPRNEPGRRQFYRYLIKILGRCNWKKSSNSVVMVDNQSAALSIMDLARRFNARHANVYRAVPI
jgi:hypothetical protein